jgi:hypothetical protein
MGAGVLVFQIRGLLAMALTVIPASMYLIGHRGKLFRKKLKIKGALY